MPILTHEERIGTLLGNCRLEEILGEGGMGVVYRATHSATGRAVAVKVLRQPLAADPNAHKRFEREARAAAALRHPNVIDVLDLGTSEDGASFMVLELLEGESLGDLLERAAPLSPAQALSVMLPVVDALATAHAHGFAHRDLKPDNIFLARSLDGSITPKLLDFGLAKPLMAQEATQLTATGNVFGTPSYMSPEQAQGLPDLDHTFDLWAVGVILFEALTGRPPFEAPTAAMLMNKLLSERAPMLRDVLPEVPAPIARVVDRTLDPQLSKRPADAVSLKRELAEAATQVGIPLLRTGAEALDSLPSPSEGPRAPVATVTEPALQAPIPKASPRRRVPLLAAGFGLGGLLLGAAYLALRPTVPTETPLARGALEAPPEVPPPEARPSEAPSPETQPSKAPQPESPQPDVSLEPSAPLQPRAERSSTPRRTRRRPHARPESAGMVNEPSGVATMSALPALRGWMQ